MVAIIPAGRTGRPALYRYQPFMLDRLRTVIVDNRLYFSNPASFNDPWDCKPYFDLDLTDDAAVADCIEFFVRSDLRNTSLSDEERKRREHVIRTDRAFLEYCVRQMNGIHRAIDERYRVYCMAGSPYTPLMWAHYAASHTGVCLEFAVQGGPFGTALPVQYRLDYPPLRLGSKPDGLIVLLAKSEDWSYEDEHRMIAEERAVASTAPGVLRTDSNLLEFPKECLRAVFVGCQMPQNHIDQVADLMREGAPHAKLKQMQRRPDRYALMDAQLVL